MRKLTPAEIERMSWHARERYRINLIKLSRTCDDRRAGTRAGYKAHLDRGEKACEACREANRLYSSQTRKRNPRKIKGCGTYAGYLRHWKQGTEPCAKCRTAARRYQRKAYKSRRVIPLQPCGTYGAWRRHKRRQETPCEACREAKAAASREWRKQADERAS